MKCSCITWFVWKSSIDTIIQSLKPIIIDIQMSIMYRCMLKILWNYWTAKQLLENKETQKNKQIKLKDNQGLKIMKVMKVLQTMKTMTTLHLIRMSQELQLIKLNHHITNENIDCNWLWIRTIDKAKNSNSLHTCVGFFSCFVFEYISLEAFNATFFQIHCILSWTCRLMRILYFL